MKKTIKTLVAASVAASVAVVGVAYFGLVNVGADDPHFPAVHAFLSMTRDRSIEVRSKDIQVPNLDDQALIKAGAGNYNSMCIGCHLAPGVADTELSQALYPAPPNLTKVGIDSNPAAAFWVIKHGIKATGMPAWGKSMGDEYLWGMVAFLDKLPKLNAQQYQALVASSSGHAHGGGETQMHDHEGQHGSAKAHPHGEPEVAADHHAAQSAMANGGADHHGEPEAATDHHVADSAMANEEVGHHGDSSDGADHHASGKTDSGSDEDHHAADSPKAEGGAGHHEAEHAQQEQAAIAAPKTHTHADGEQHLHNN